jgi:hypothetical protein
MVKSGNKAGAAQWFEFSFDDTARHAKPLGSSPIGVEFRLPVF